MLDGKHARGGNEPDEMIYVAMNMHWQKHWFELPGLPEGMNWHVFANTGAYDASFTPGEEPRLDDQKYFILNDRSVAILVGR